MSETGIPYAEVIGDPIEHSRSPAIHGFWIEKLGIEAEYRLAHVRADQLSAYFHTRQADLLWRGCNVTIPHKESVLRLLGSTEPGIRRLGAANCVFRPRHEERLALTNTDVDGILEAVGGKAIRGAEVCLIGAGGAARGALQLMATNDAKAVRMIVRDKEKGDRLRAEFGLEGRSFGFGESMRAMLGATLVINASPLGMVGQEPMPPALIENLSMARPDAVVFDMVYAPLETELLTVAERTGRDARDGLAMLIGQAAFAFSRFFGERAPRQHDEELRALLTG